MSDVRTELSRLVHLLRTEYEQQQLQLKAYADPELNSPCQFGEVVDGEVTWWPQQREGQFDFSGLEHGLEFQMHPDLKAFYSAYWGSGLPLTHARGQLELLQIWHQEDYERLCKNIIAHVLMKRRLRQRETIFFAVTDNEDSMLSVLNETGEVYLEYTGCEVKELLAPDLGTFLQQLTLR